MIEAKRIQQQQSAKRQVELDRIQKARDQAYKKELLEQMRREKNEKLGKKQQQAKQSGQTIVKKELKYTKIEQLQIQCEQVKVGMQDSQFFRNTKSSYLKEQLWCCKDIYYITTDCNLIKLISYQYNINLYNAKNNLNNTLKKSSDILERYNMLCIYPISSNLKGTYIQLELDMIITTFEQRQQYQYWSQKQVKESSLFALEVNTRLHNNNICSDSTLHIQNAEFTSQFKQTLIHLIPRTKGDLAENDKIYDILREYPLRWYQHYSLKSSKVIISHQQFKDIQEQTKLYERLLSL